MLRHRERKALVLEYYIQLWESRSSALGRLSARGASVSRIGAHRVLVMIEEE